MSLPRRRVQTSILLYSSSQVERSATGNFTNRPLPSDVTAAARAKQSRVEKRERFFVTHDLGLAMGTSGCSTDVPLPHHFLSCCCCCCCSCFESRVAHSLIRFGLNHQTFCSSRASYLLPGTHNPIVDLSSCFLLHLDQRVCFVAACGLCVCVCVCVPVWVSK